jgi:hypothetical protein
MPMGPICSTYPHLIIFIPIKNQLLVQLLFKPNNVTSELPLLKCQSCSRSQPSEKYSFCFGIISATTTENDKYIQILETANQEILVKIQMSPSPHFLWVPSLPAFFPPIGSQAFCPQARHGPSDMASIGAGRVFPSGFPASQLRTVLFLRTNQEIFENHLPISTNDFQDGKMASR